ncbi:MAG: MmcQ/YjbR family DNA-binding protein [Chloroflexota bacterium]|nr:MmcQ/YjbR family DNA-binding protein [Chloroflexota bacterium]
MVTFDAVRALALALPGVEETTSYGTPAFKVRGKLIARLQEEGDVLVVKAEIGHRDALIAARPDVYFVTPHYKESRYVLVRLAAVDRDELADLLADAWHLVAPKRLATSLPSERKPGESRADS